MDVFDQVMWLKWFKSPIKVIKVIKMIKISKLTVKLLIDVSIDSGVISRN